MKIRNTTLLFLLSIILHAHVMAAETKGVIVTIKPLHSLVAGVIGNTGKAELLLTGNSSPHDFQLKPSQMKHLQEAKIIFSIAPSFESFLMHTLETLPDSIQKVAVAQQSGLLLLKAREGGAWDVHTHEEHEHEDKHEEQLNGYYNMHVWLNPENAKIITQSIATELSAIYPENSAIYNENARILINKVDVLDAELRITLSEVGNKPFIVFHDAYQYFEQAYGLNAVGSITFNPDEPSTPKRIIEIREKLQQTGASCIFHEPQFSDRLINTITEGTNTKSGILDPLGANLTEGDHLYFDLLKNLAANLKQCLQ